MVKMNHEHIICVPIILRNKILAILTQIRMVRQNGPQRYKMKNHTDTKKRITPNTLLILGIFN
jgi:hypothetical protein